MRLLMFFGLALAFCAQPLSAQDISTPIDARKSLPRDAQERDFILSQMRLFLETEAAVQNDLAAGDMLAVSADAAARGARASAALVKPPHLAEKEPAEWKMMIRATRENFDLLADRARGGAGRDALLAILAATTQNCVACHQAYRIVEAP